MANVFGSLTKRQRFIISSVFALGISVLFQASNYPLYYSVPALIVGTYIITLFSLRDDLKGVEYLTLYILPVTFLIGINLFMLILPQRKIFRFPFYGLIPIGMYITYLTENIFNVAAIRTIQLLRAAHAVAYIFSLFSAYFLISYIISLRLELLLQLLYMVLVIFPLTLQFLWSFDLLPVFSRRTILYSCATCLVFIQILVMANFYPQSTAMTSLFLVAVYYVLLGILQHFYEKKLTRKPTIEYTIVACIVFIIMLFTAQWHS
jgi:hypothetical protein